MIKGLINCGLASFVLMLVTHQGASNAFAQPSISITNLDPSDAGFTAIQIIFANFDLTTDTSDNFLDFDANEPILDTSSFPPSGFTTQFFQSRANPLGVFSDFGVSEIRASSANENDPNLLVQNEIAIDFENTVLSGTSLSGLNGRFVVENIGQGDFASGIFDLTASGIFSGPVTLFVDQVSVPEPATAPLLAFSLLSLLRRRRGFMPKTQT